MLQCEARESNLFFSPRWAGSSVLSPHLGRSASGLWVMFKTLGEIALSAFLRFSRAPSVFWWDPDVKLFW